MATPTYIPLQTTTLGSSASSITFASIPNSYRDLVLIISGGSSGALNTFKFDFNNDTGNKSIVIMRAYSGNIDSYTASNLYTITDGSNYHSVIQIMDYSATDKNKNVLIHDTLMGQTRTYLNAGRWASNAAITSIKLSEAGQTWDAGTTFSLYGIAG